MDDLKFPWTKPGKNRGASYWSNLLKERDYDYSLLQGRKARNLVVTIESVDCSRNENNNFYVTKDRYFSLDHCGDLTDWDCHP